MKHSFLFFIPSAGVWTLGSDGLGASYAGPTGGRADTTGLWTDGATAENNM